MKHPWNLNRALVVLGAILIFSACAVMVIGAPSHAGSVAPVAIGGLLGLAIVFYAPAWMYLLSAFFIAAFPLVIIFVFGAIDGIRHPGGGFEASALLLLLAGAFTAIIGGVSGVVQASKDNAPTVGAGLGAPQGAFAGLVVAALLGMVVSNVLVSADVRAFAEAPASYIESSDAEALLVAGGTKFAPTPVTLVAGQLTDLRIRNDDPVFHTLSYRHDGAIRTALLPANVETHLWLKFDEPQTIAFWCDPHSGGEGDTSADSMIGSFVVQ